MLYPRADNQHSLPSRVVITGAGVVTALGTDYAANASGFRAGRTAFRPVTLFDVQRQRVQWAGEVNLPEPLPATRLTEKQAGRLYRAARLLIHATAEAWTQSGWEAGEDIAVVMGTTSGGMSHGEAYYRQAIDAPLQRHGQVNRILQYLVQSQSQLLAAAFGFRGPQTVIANACASGANAIGHAWQLIRHGHSRRVLAGGYDALSQLVFAGFDSLQALSTTQCRPFDANRDGLALGEGAAVLTLESLDDARNRGAMILGEITGYSAASDVHHMTQPHPQGVAARRTMTEACRLSGIAPDQVDYINAHGTGTPLNDSAEAQAINDWAGDAVASIPVSSTKAGIGHLLGAAGAVEAVVGLMTLREGWLPPNANLESPDPACRFPLVRQPTDRDVTHMLTNSFGFGGANATLALKRWNGHT